MDNESILKILKTDLEISGTSRDEMLMNVIEQAKAAIERKGIKLNETTEDGMLVENYAAFLYRKRREEVFAMPRYLTVLINERLFSQKARGE